MPKGSKLKWFFVGGKVNRLNREATDAYNHGDNQEALRLLIRARDKYPGYEVTHHNLGNVHMALGRYGEAERSLRKALEIKPDFVEAMNDLASLLVKREKKYEAEELLRKAVETDPDYPYAHVNLARIMIDQGNFSEAEVEFRRALECKKLDPDTRKQIEDQMVL